MKQSFSKIWIIVVLVTLLAGGILVWQYFGPLEERVETPEQIKITECERKDVKSFINITFPKGGEQLVRGQTYEIRWKAKGVDYVKIELLNKWHKAYSHVIVSKYPNTGAFRWTIPLDPQGIRPTRDYVIDIMAVGQGVGDRSELFDIVMKAEKVKPSITVITPNGGEQWVAGNTYEIKWSSQGINSNLPVGITLVDYAQNKEYELETRAKIGDGKFIWTYVPAHTAYTGPESLFSGDKFKIRVYVATKDIAVQYPDESDRYFSIVTASVGLKDIDNQLASVSEAVSRLMEGMRKFL